MIYTTQITGHKAIFGSEIVNMLLTGFIFLVLQSSVQAQWTPSGNNISNTNTGNVGVGTPSPTQGKVVVSDTI